MNTTEDRSRHYFYSQVYTLSGLLFTLLHPKGPKSRACGSEKPLLLQLVCLHEEEEKGNLEMISTARGKKA